MSDALLSIQGLTKAFGGLVAVSDLSIDAVEGQTLGLIGPNGAGKTTVLSLITGFIRPDSGTVLLDGADVTGMRTHKLVRRGLVRSFQGNSVYGDLSVRGNVMTALQTIDDTGLARRIALGPFLGRSAQLAEEADHFLAQVGLAEVADESAGSLPYGSQRMLGLAMTMSLRPRVLLLDEPAAGMNADERDDLIELLQRLRSAGTTVVLIEHDVPLVAAVCDRIVVINYGSKIAEGTPDEIRADPAVIEAYLGEEEEEDE